VLEMSAHQAKAFGSGGIHGASSRTSLTVGSTRTPKLAMASPFLWPALVPSALAGSGAG
jgi:hypothetical protein